MSEQGVPAQKIDPLSYPDGGLLGRVRPRRLVVPAAKGGVSIAIVWFLLDKVDFGVLSERLGVDALAPLATGIAAGLLIMVVTALRWWRIHQRIRAPVPFRFSVPATMECYALNLALPGSVGGDIVRAARATRLCGRVRESVMAVLLDRGGNLAAQMIMCLISLPFLQPAMASGDLRLAILLVAATGVGGVAIVYGAPGLVAFGRIRRFRPIRELVRIGLILRRIVRLPFAVVEIAVLSFVIQALNVAMIWAAALAIGHDGLPLFTLVVAMAFGMLGSALPVSFGGLGVREGAVAWVLIEAGMASGDAFMIAVVFGALVLTQAVPGLFIWAFGRMPPIVAR